MTVQISLNEAEKHLAFFLSAERYIRNRDGSVSNGRIGPQPDSFIDLNGIGGEIAVAKHYGVYPDTSLYPRSCGYDLFINGNRADVKTTHHKNGSLLCTLKKNDDVDFYILVTGTFPDYTIVGYAHSSELRLDSNITDKGHGKGYCIEQSKLKPITSTP